MAGPQYVWESFARVFQTVLKGGKHLRAERSEWLDHRRISRSSSSGSVDSLQFRSRSPRWGHRSRKGKSPARHSLAAATRGQRRSWADHMSDSEEEQMDNSKVPTFSDSEAEDQPPSKLVEVSEKARIFLHEKCTRRVPNSERKDLRDRYLLPKVPATI